MAEGGRRSIPQSTLENLSLKEKSPKGFEIRVQRMFFIGFRTET